MSHLDFPLPPGLTKILSPQSSIQKISRAFSPSDIPNLALWLDASDASTITLNGADVSQWDDKSGNGRNVTQGTPSSQPLYDLAAQNGKNVVNFNGSTEWLLGAAYNFFAQPYTIFVVGKASGQDQDFFGWTQAAVHGVLLEVRAGNAIRYLHRHQPTGGITDDLLSTANFSYSTETALTFTRDVSDNMEIFMDGTSRGSLAGVQPFQDNAGQGWSLGRLAAGISARYLNGNIAEFLIYEQTLTVSQRQQVESYLINKWGI